MENFAIFIDFCGYKKRGDEMSPQVGRPTDDPKNLNTRIRLSENDVEKLNYCTEKLGVKKAEVIRMGINKVYEDLKK